jgi:hypothetical protein
MVHFIFVVVVVGFCSMHNIELKNLNFSLAIIKAHLHLDVKTFLAKVIMILNVIIVTLDLSH